MKYFLSVMKSYATFAGRARRMEYWMFSLISLLFYIAAAILDNALGTTLQIAGNSIGYGYIYMFYGLVVFLPSLAVMVRRLHDIGKSGWFFWIVLIPIAGAIWLLVVLFKDSQPGVNKYGPNPKGIGNNEFDSIDA